MAVTITLLAGGSRAKKWLVTWSLDADTVATIPHGMLQRPEFAPLIPLNAEAYVGHVARTAIDDTNITLTKNVAVGSGGAQVEVVAFGNQTLL